MRRRIMAGVGAVALAASGVILTAPVSSATAQKLCTVAKPSPGWGYSVCHDGYGTQRAVVTCGSGSSLNINYGPWVPADGVSQSHAYCRIPTTVVLVGAEHRP